MAESTLEERLANYGTALDDARRQGVVRRVSVARRLVPAGAFVAAFALVIGTVVVIPRDDSPDRTRPADVATAEAEIRQAFSTFNDRTATEAERRAAREASPRDPAAVPRIELHWRYTFELFGSGDLGGSVRRWLDIERISFTSDKSADVDFRIYEVGSSDADPSLVSDLTSSVPGSAVFEDGRWRVGVASICALSLPVPACAPDDFLTKEQQAIGEPFINGPWRGLSDDQRVRDIEGGSEIRDQILDVVNRFRSALSDKAELLAVRHRPGAKTARVWWTVGTVQPGVAVFDGDHWTVSRETWCQLAHNAGEYPPACGGGPTTTTTVSPTTTTSTSLPIVESFTYTADGPLVRGAWVEITLRGLDRLRGQEVGLAVSARRPKERLYSLEDVAGPLEGGTVSEDGALVVETAVPSYLLYGGGSSDLFPIEPGAAYQLFVTAGNDLDIWYEAPFRFAAAGVGVAYRTVARNYEDAEACGAPPIEVQFDARNWVPDDGSTFVSSPKVIPGTFTLLSDTTARFTFEDGREVPFTRASGWSC